MVQRSRALVVNASVAAKWHPTDEPDALVHLHGIAYYDALAVALALRQDVPFVTAGRGLYPRAGDLPEMLWPADWAR